MAAPFFAEDSIRVNFDEVALNALAAGKRGSAIFQDLEQRAIRVQTAASRLCPVDTGRLRSSIDYVVVEDALGPVAYVGTNVEYALYVELGTFNQQAQPFLRPALAAA